MNHKARIIKRGDRKKPEPDRLEQSPVNPTREITTTIKMWVSEFKEKRRTDEQNARRTIELIFGI